MAIREHPEKGSILTCDFGAGFKVPEMDKKRPVIILSPKIVSRPFLCTVVSLSTTEPEKVMPYHRRITINPPLPRPFQSDEVWIKGDMVNAVGFHRLDFIRRKQVRGKEKYYTHTLSDEQMKLVQSCVLRGIGLSNLTKYL